jgi:hypothetical protein
VLGSLLPKINKAITRMIIHSKPPGIPNHPIGTVNILNHLQNVLQNKY